jgi:TetR/AcrR family transcriptional regulator
VPAQQRPRRAPRPDERQRDAERSRRQLLAAALEEFAAKGYSGARVQDIADRAGVNKQLINYYFGGKEGLYHALHRSWQEREARFADPEAPLEEIVVRYLHETLAEPCPARLVLWQGLRGGAPEHPPEEDLPDMVRRKERGELAADLDPAAVLLAVMGAVLAPVAMPQVARRMFGADAATPEFRQRYGEQLRRIVRRFAEVDTGSTGGSGPGCAGRGEGR